MSSPISKLPIELSDMILDHLRDDHITLKHCSLATRTLLPSTRTHLFRRIVVCEPTKDALGRFHAFQELIAANAALQIHIKELVLIGGEPTSIALRNSQSEPLTTADLVSMLLHLPRLRTLKISRVRLCKSPEENLPASFKPISLDVLQMESVGSDYENLADYLSFLSLFSSIGELRQGSIRCGWDIRRLQLALVGTGEVEEVVGPVEDAIPSSLEIQSIMVETDSVYPAILCEIIRRTKSRRTLKKVDIYGETQRDLQSLAALLSELGPNLTHITFHPEGVMLDWRSPVPSHYWNMFNFESFTSLQSLTITLPIDDTPRMEDGNSNQSLSECAIDILALIPKTLRQLSLGFDSRLFTDYKTLEEESTNFDWDSMEPIVKKFKSLDMLAFEYYTYPLLTPPGTEEFVSKWEATVRDRIVSKRLLRLLVVRVQPKALLQ